MVSLLILLSALTIGTNVPTGIYVGTNAVQAVSVGTNVVWTSFVEPTGRIAHWQMEEGSGTNVADSSGLTNRLTLQGTVLWGAGKVGSYSLYFPGTNSLALSLDNRGEVTNCVTIMAWVKPNTVTNGQYIIAKNFSTTWRGVIMGYQSGKWNIYNQNYPLSGNTTTGAITAAAGEWQHIVYASCGTNLAGYRNGVRVVNVPGANLNSLNANNWRIGQYTTGSLFAGFLDDVRIYNRALTDAEVNAIYQRTK
jgi:hypothetical protein